MDKKQLTEFIYQTYINENEEIPSDAEKQVNEKLEEVQNTYDREEIIEFLNEIIQNFNLQINFERGGSIEDSYYNVYVGYNKFIKDLQKNFWLEISIDTPDNLYFETIDELITMLNDYENIATIILNEMQ